MYFGCFDFRGELGFLNCDDVCMCVVNKQLSSSSPFMLTCNMMRFLSLLLLGLCACVVFVVLGLSLRLSWYCCDDCDACTVVCVACVYAAIMLGCEGDGNAGVGPGEVCGCGECVYGWYTWFRYFV